MSIVACVSRNNSALGSLRDLIHGNLCTGKHLVCVPVVFIWCDYGCESARSAVVVSDAEIAEFKRELSRSCVDIRRVVIHDEFQRDESRGIYLALVYSCTYIIDGRNMIM